MKDVVEIFMGDLKCELQRFSPKPGDVFVLTVPGRPSEELADRLTAVWRAEFPNTKIAVIGDGLKVELESD